MVDNTMDLHSLEFFTYESDLMCRMADGSLRKITENDHDIVDAMVDRIETLYPKAYAALKTEYAKCQSNIPYFRYRVVNRFCRCNFGMIDNVEDLDQSGRMHFERVACPLRGECRLEGVVCDPVFDSRISAAEMRVLRLLCEGLATDVIADRLCLSIHTVRNHIRNAYQRIGVHNQIELMQYATKNNLFDL